MERRSFIRSLLAGLALAPLASCLIDIPDAAPPALVDIKGSPLVCRHLAFSWTPGDPCSRCMGCGAWLAGRGVWGVDMAALGSIDYDVYPVVQIGQTHARGSVPLRGQYMNSHALRLKRSHAAPVVDLQPLTEGRGWDAELRRSSFAEWDRRVGKALLS